MKPAIKKTQARTPARPAPKTHPAPKPPVKPAANKDRPKGQPSNGDPNKPEKAPPPPLPESLIASLPAARDIVNHLREIDKRMPALKAQLLSAKERGAIDLARAFVVMHRMMAVLSGSEKWMDELFTKYKELDCPEVFEAAGVTHVPLAEGYRVGLNYLTRASIRAGLKEVAHQWLIENGHQDIITETVNASTLSALARTLQEEENLSLPEDLFNVALMTNTSVTKT